MTPPLHTPNRKGKVCYPREMVEYQLKKTEKLINAIEKETVMIIYPPSQIKTRQ